MTRPTRDKVHCWKWARDNSVGWNVRVQFWRCQIQWTLIRHRYPATFQLNPGKQCSPTRWVVQSSTTYDVRERSAA